MLKDGYEITYIVIGSYNIDLLPIQDFFFANLINYWNLIAEIIFLFLSISIIVSIFSVLFSSILFSSYFMNDFGRFLLLFKKSFN